MASPKISLTIPYHSNLPYLADAVASVLRQAVPNWELLVCDDSATGEARDLVRGTGDDRIRWIRTSPGGGIAANWNACLAAATTDLVTLLHGDDMLLPGYAGLMLTAAEADPTAAAFFCRTTVVDAAGRPARSFREWVKDRISPSTTRPYSLDGDSGLAALALGDFIMCPTLCYRRSSLGARRFGTTYRSALDLEMKTGLLLDGRRLVGLPEVEYAYRRHGENESELRKEGFDRFIEEMELLDAVADEARRLGWSRAARIAFARPLVRLHLASEAMRHALHLRPALARRALGLAASTKTPARP